MRAIRLLIVALCVMLPALAWAIVPPPDPEFPPTEGYPGDLPPPPQPPVQVTVLNTIGDALVKPDSTSVQLLDKVVIGDPYDTGNDFFYIEEDDRSSGILVNVTTPEVTRGDRVNVVGTMSTTDGQRCIDASEVTVIAENGIVPDPLGMDNITLGGGGIGGYSIGVTSPIGPYNRGLLVRVWGKVRSKDPSGSWFYVDDGRGLADGSGNTGVKVEAGNIGTLPSVDQYVVVTGVSASFVSNSLVRRLVRARDYADVRIVTGQTVTSPVSTIWPDPRYVSPPLWSVIGLPAVPLDPSPATVFEHTRQKGFLPGDTLNYNLWRWDPLEQPTWPHYIPYLNPPLPEHPAFGPVYSGEGYWVRTDDPTTTGEGGISYSAVLEPLTSTDRYIALRHEDPLWNLVGCPGFNTIPFEDLEVTDGLRTLSLRDAWSEANWVSPDGWWMENSTQSLCTVGLPEGFSASEVLEPWRGYWIGAYKNDLALIVPAPPPPPSNLVAVATGSNRITLYWDRSPSVTGYNIYRGTVSGGEDYQNPINGSLPVNTPSYPGSSVCIFTDSGLTTGAEYFYTVTTVCDEAESVPSSEDSDMPDAWAIPWDTDDPSAITNAAANLYGYAADLVCALALDGTVYSNWEGILRPGGPVDLGTLDPGTNILYYSDGSSLVIPDDGGILSGEAGESLDMQPMGVPPTMQLNASDGPYRRVRSLSTCTGVSGIFYPGWAHAIYMSPQHPDDTYWTYLGNRTVIGSGDRQAIFEVDAGLQWSRVYWRYNPHLSLKYKRYDGVEARTLAPKEWPIRFDTSYYSGIAMAYVLQPSGKGSVPMILFDGAIQSWDEATILLAAASPVKVTSGMMKRVHSIAQGKPPNHYRLTGSYFYYASFDHGGLRNASGQWVAWTEELSSQQGAYPWPSPIVTWTVPTGSEYYEEDDICIHLE